MVYTNSTQVWLTNGTQVYTNSTQVVYTNATQFLHIFYIQGRSFDLFQLTFHSSSWQSSVGILPVNTFWAFSCQQINKSRRIKSISQQSQTRLIPVHAVKLNLCMETVAPCEIEDLRGACSIKDRCWCRYPGFLSGNYQDFI